MMINIITFFGIGFWSLVRLLSYLFNIKGVVSDCYKFKDNYCDSVLYLIHVRMLLSALTFLFIVRIFILSIIISMDKWVPIALFIWYLSFNLSGYDKQIKKEKEWTKKHKMTLLDIKMKFMKKKK